MKSLCNHRLLRHVFHPIVFFCGFYTQFGAWSAAKIKTNIQIATMELLKTLQKKDQQASVLHWTFLYILKTRESIMVQCVRSSLELSEE